MRFIGCLLLVSGWLLGLVSLVLLTGPKQRFAFLTAGLLVEFLGLALIAQRYRSLQRGQQ